MSRAAELAARRQALLESSTALRAECAATLTALAPAARVLDGAQGLLARLRRLPLRLIVSLARAGLRESLSNDARRAALIAGAGTGVIALIKRWTRRRNRP